MMDKREELLQALGLYHPCSCDQWSWGELISRVETLRKIDTDIERLRTDNRIVTNQNKELAAECVALRHMQLTPEQRTAIISHLANQRGVLRGQAARERNRTTRYDIERNIDEINALIEVLRACSN